MKKVLTHGSTFSGIGAAEIAADMLGWHNAFHCEINPFGRTILDYYFPNAESYNDITTTDFSKWGGQIDILTGGFPCQPFSYAGKRRGTKDDRYLWPFMLKCIEQVRPTWFVGENVAGLSTMVFPGKDVKVGSQATLFGEIDNMERRERYVIEEICQQLENIGYSVQPILIPACGVGAPHRRDRIFIIAHAQDTNSMGSQRNEVMGHTQRPRNFRSTGNDGQTQQPLTNTNRNKYRTPTESGKSESNRSYRLCQPCQWCLKTKWPYGLSQIQEYGYITNTACRWARRLRNTLKAQGSRTSNELSGVSCGIHGKSDVTNTYDDRLQKARIAKSPTMLDGKDLRYLQSENRWRTFPTISPVYRGNDGIPFSLDNLTIPFARWKNESLKAYGNAIVVQVMYEIFRAIDEIENQDSLRY